MTTAILFMVFNRPDTTAMVMESIRKAAPPRLYIAADGPRTHVAGEDEMVQSVRDLVVNNIDWPCKVYTRFPENNLGCKHAVSSAIGWFFEHEEEGIILEDDCVPNQGFFTFCEQMLERYRNDTRIACINGNHLTGTKQHTTDDYYFTIFPNVWGWASWRRVWQLYDADIKDWPGWNKRGDLQKVLHGKYARQAGTWEAAFNDVYYGRLDTWDHQFVFALFAKQWLAVQPYYNLVSNIGHGYLATHTNDPLNPRANQPTRELTFPLRHPIMIKRNYYIENHLVSERKTLIRVVRRIARMVKMTLRKIQSPRT